MSKSQQNAVVIALVSAAAFLAGRLTAPFQVDTSADTFIRFWKACYEEQKAKADLFQTLFVKCREERQDREEAAK